MIKVTKYKSGLTLIHLRRKIRDAVYLEFRFKAGLYNDPKEKLGLSHFAEHAVKLSNNTYTKDEKNNHLFGLANFNFATSTDSFYFYAYVSDEEFEECIKRYTNYLSDFNVNKVEFENERKVIIQEIKERKWDIGRQLNIDIATYMRRRKYHFKNLPQVTPAGTVDSVNNITLQDVQEYLLNTITQDNCILTVVGNISLRKTNQLIKKYVLKQMAHGTGKKYRHSDEFYNYDTKPIFNISPSPEQDRSQIVITSHCCLGKIDRLRIRAKFILRDNFKTAAHEYFREQFGLSYSQWLGFGTSTFDYLDKQYGFYEIIINCNKDNISKVLDVLPGFYSFLQNYKLDQEKLTEIQTRIRQLNKCSAVKTYSQIGRSLCDQYFDRGHIYTKKENKAYDKAAEKISLDYVNDYMYKILTSKPFIFVVSNTEDKLPEYNKLCRDIKKNLKWLDEVYQPQAKNNKSKNAN